MDDVMPAEKKKKRSPRRWRMKPAFPRVRAPGVKRCPPGRKPLPGQLSLMPDVVPDVPLPESK